MNLRLLGGLAASAAVCVAYGTFVEAHAFQVRRVEVPVLPEGASPIRVLHLSDFHLVTGQRRKLSFISSLAGLEPDLVISTGDNLADPEALTPLLLALGRLLKVPGAFVFGSNDYTGPEFSNPLGYLVRASTRDGVEAGKRTLPTEQLRLGLRSGGWADINAAKVRLTVQGLELEIRGTNDAHLGLDDYSLVAGEPASGVDVALGVTHAPYRRVLDAMTQDGLDLILAGHTHGGQVCVPGWGALTTNCDLPPRQAKGLHRHSAGAAETWLHVSAGLGMSPTAPYRFACPPEVTLLTLTPPPLP